MIPHIYILILNWNGLDLLKPCIDSVLAIDYQNFTTLVIDNGSSDGSVEMIKNRYPNVEYLQLSENFGFSGGYNHCFDYLEQREVEYILLLNNDTKVDPNILVSFIKATEKYGNHHIYGPKIFYNDYPNKIWYAGGNINLKWGRITHRGIRQFDSVKYSHSIQTDYITGCCLFTSWKVIKILDGFDSQFNMYGEDVDLCLRAKKEDIYCYYWPDSEIWHHVSASLGSNWNLKKIFKQSLSLIKLYIKYNF